MTQRAGVRRARSLFISDVHLGTRGCQADRLLDFLRSHEAKTIYLVGDIVDGWRLRPGQPWPRPHLDVAATLLARACEGTRVVYIPGNHDESLRKFIGLRVGNIEVAESAVHETSDGRRYLVLHGDQVDLVVQRIRWVAFLGDWAYSASLVVSPWVDLMRRRLGLPGGSFSARAKFRVKSIVNAISRSEEQLAAEVRRHGVDGVICGHTHHAADGYLAGVHYLNTGDWVESCTGLIEHEDGHLEIVHWADGAMTQAADGQMMRNCGVCLPETKDIPIAV